MIDIKLLREEPDRIKRGIEKKGVQPELVDEFLKLDREWREITKKLDDLRAGQKKFSHSVHSGQAEARNIEAAKKNKEDIKSEEVKLEVIEGRRMAVWRKIPNLPLPDAPIGKSEKDNKVLCEVGEKSKFSFPPKDYLTLAESLGLIDVERAAKVAGSRFGYLLGAAARLEFALGQLVLETLADQKILTHIIKKNGLTVSDTPFIPVIPPVLLNEKSMAGMGYLERGGEEVYKIEKDDLYLAGTSEQALGPMHQNEVFEEKDLPRRYVGFSTCFRREAGSYGKDTKGILRVHQFDKFEMFSFVKPETSVHEHRLLLGVQEHLMQKLELPYRVIEMCTADLGDPAAAKFDIETWMPGQRDGKGEYRETHSASNTTDYQARRLSVKYRTGKDIEFVHMLNGTAFAVGRTLITIFENFQTKEGKIKIPKVLQKYVGAKVIS